MDIRKGEMICIFDHPDILDFFKKMQVWNENNTWSKSVLSDTSQNHYKEGRAASYMHNADSWVSLSVARPDVESLFYMTVPYTTRHRAMQDGQAIPASAANPERALMMFERFFQDKEYWMMLAYGIEGTHYTITDNGELNPLDTDIWVPGAYCDWGLQRVEWKLPVIGQPENTKEVWDWLASLGELNPYAIFFADFEPIRNERAAVTEVYNQYAYPLAYGFVEDVDAGFAELMEKLDQAGLRVMEAELQSQLEAYKTANNIE
jgi:putative aldouronate transport system substrate-binding protein